MSTVLTVTYIYNLECNSWTISPTCPGATKCRGEYPRKQIDECRNKMLTIVNLHHRRNQGQAQTALPSFSAGLCIRTCTVIASVLPLFTVRRWLVRRVSHDEDEREILPHLISLHGGSSKALPGCHGLTSRASRCSPSSPSIGELDTSGGVTSSHAISTSCPCTTGHDGPCLHLAVSLAASPSFSSPVPAMHRRHFAAVMRAGRL